MNAVVLASLWSSPAAADAEVVVTADRPCIVVVNFAPYPTTGGQDVVVHLPDGREGEQNVRIRTLLGDQQWAGKVTVGPGQRATLVWARGGMTYGAVEALPPPKSKASVPRPSAVRPEPAPTSAPAPFRPAPPGEDPLVAVVRAAAVEGGGGGRPEAEPEPPPTGSAASVTLANRTGSWANVSFDGEVFEFRGERERAIELGSGVHRVEFREFRDTQVWWSGELWVFPDDHLELQFSQAAAPAVPGRPDAWHPSPDTAP